MKSKRIVYLISSALLGIILSLLVHAGIEFMYLDWARDAGRNIVWHGGCALPVVIQIPLLLIGALGGFMLGRFWWLKVYIEHAWRGFKK